MGTMTPEECPLCCEPMDSADITYPLHCTTPSCQFQLCFACLQQLAKSAADGYAEASDGSHQVKVALQCPQCRGEYSNKQADPCLTTTSVVHAVLRLRQAASTPLPGTVPDSQLSATQLSHRIRFLEEVGNVKILQDSLKLVQRYHDSLRSQKDWRGITQPVVFPELDWEAWRSHLEEAAHRTHQHSAASCGMISSSDSADSAELVLPRDPTLFLGLEDFMTLDEQEFITRMLVSGHAETVQQAASLLQNMTQVSVGQRSATAVQQLAFANGSGGGGGGASNTTNNKNSRSNQNRACPRLSKAQLEHQQRVRNRFPLPIHMPRSVTLPLYDPVYEKKAQLEFVAMQPKYIEKQRQQHIPELTLTAVRGAAGRVGLRKGDVVTHVHGETVSTVGEFIVALQLCNDNDGTFQLTVNANDTTALALRSRAQEMKLQKIRFHG